MILTAEQMYNKMKDIHAELKDLESATIVDSNETILFAISCRALLIKSVGASIDRLYTEAAKLASESSKVQAGAR